MIRTPFNIILILFCALVEGQNFRPVQLNYQYARGVNVGSSDFTDLTNTKRSEQSILEAILKYPIFINNKKITLIPELTHKVIGQNFNSWHTSLDEPRTGNLTRLAVNAIFSVNQKWSLLGAITASQGVNSTIKWDFSNNFYRFGIGFLINNSAGNRIGGAVRYVEELAIPVPLFLFYGTSANSKWYYNISFPASSSIEYSMNDKWRLRFVERIDNDRFMLNATSGSNYNQSMLNLSVGASYGITKSLFFSLQAGFTPINFLTFYSDKTNDLGTVNLEMQPSIGASFYYNINTSTPSKD